MTIVTNSPRIAPLLVEDSNKPGQPVKWNVAPGGTITYSFVTPETASTYNADLSGKTPETNIQEVNDKIKANVRQIFKDVYGTVVPLNFQEVPDSAASNIRIMFSDGVIDGNAYAYGPGNSERPGAIHINPIQEKDPGTAYSSGPGSYGYSTLIHEIGHTLGLKHPGNYNAGSDDNQDPGELPFLPFSEDNSRNAIMSYNPGSATTGDPNAEEPRTLMPYDIEALQFLYGKPQTSSGNNTYKFDSNNFNNVVATIWDANGNDGLDFSALAADDTYHFDMNPGGILTKKSALNSLSYTLEKSQIPAGGDPNQTYQTNSFGTYLGFDTKIENLVGSNGNDDVIGNSLLNNISGGSGDDTLLGGKGSDTLQGGDGNDELIGAKGLDVLIGGLGNNTLTGGKGQDVFVLGPNQGTNTITDFQDGGDQLALQGGLTFNEIAIDPLNNGTEIKVSNTGEILAILPGVSNSLLSGKDFTNFVA